MALRTLPESLPPERARASRCGAPSPIDLAGVSRRDLAFPASASRWPSTSCSFSGSPAWSRRSASSPPTGSGCRTPGPGASSASWAIVSALVQGGPGLAPGPAVRRGAADSRRPRHPGGRLRAARPVADVRRRREKLALLVAAGLIALGSGLCSPTLPAFASRRASATTQGVTLGTLQSASALARALGPDRGRRALRDHRSARALPGRRRRAGAGGDSRRRAPALTPGRDDYVPVGPLRSRPLRGSAGLGVFSEPCRQTRLRPASLRLVERLVGGRQERRVIADAALGDGGDAEADRHRDRPCRRR